MVGRLCLTATVISVCVCCYLPLPFRLKTHLEHATFFPLQGDDICYSTSHRGREAPPLTFMNRLLAEHGLEQANADYLALECIQEWRNHPTIGPRIRLLFQDIHIRQWPWARLHLSTASARAGDLALWWHCWAARLARPLQRLIERADLTIEVNTFAPCSTCGEPTGSWCDGCRDFLCNGCEDRSGKCLGCLATQAAATMRPEQGGA